MRRRCIEAADELLSEADCLISSSIESVIREVAQTARGSRYFRALFEIHALVVYFNPHSKTTVILHNVLQLDMFIL